MRLRKPIFPVPCRLFQAAKSSRPARKFPFSSRTLVRTWSDSPGSTTKSRFPIKKSPSSFSFSPPNGLTTIAHLQQIVREQNSLDQDEKGTIPATNHKCYAIAMDIKKELERSGNNGLDPAKMVDRFFNQLFPEILRSDNETGATFRRDLGPHLDKLVAAKLRHITRRPAASDILTIYSELGMVFSAQALALIEGILKTLVTMGTKPEHFPSIQDYQYTMDARTFLLNDLLDVWRLFLYPRQISAVNQMTTASKGAERSPPDQIHLSLGVLKSVTTSKHLDRSKVDAMLLGLFPQTFPNARHLVRIAAIASYALFTDESRCTDNVRLHARDFISPVSTILRHGILDEEYLKATIFPSPLLLDYVVARWPVILGSFGNQRNLVADNQKSNVIGKNAPTIQSRPLSDGLMKINTIHRNLSQAVEAKDPDRVIKLWKQLKKYIRPLKEMPGLGQSVIQLLDHFVYAFIYLRSADLATEAWMTIEALGQKPTVRTWTAMLTGSRKMRNAQVVENIWQGMLAAQVVPDSHAWSARITCLAAADKYKDALSALDEMVLLWEERNSNPGTTDKKIPPVKPTIVHVNSILAQLAKNSMEEECHNLLQWAETKGLKPDTTTFNILIKMASKTRDPAAVRDAFRRLAKAGCEPDDSTMTLLIDALMPEGSDLSPDSQTVHVRSIIWDIEESGFNLNQEHYGKIIYHLLQRGPKTQEAVKEVLDHMHKKRGRDMSPHICSMLVNYYFSLDPPATEQIWDILQERQLGINHDNQALRVDRVLWENALVGFARLGRMPDMLHIWKALESSWGGARTGPPVTMAPAHDFLVALIQQQKLDVAQNLVRMMENWAVWKTGTEEPHLAKRLWQHRFWALSRRYGFINSN